MLAFVWSLGLNSPLRKKNKNNSKRSSQRYLLESGNHKLEIF